MPTILRLIAACALACLCAGRILADEAPALSRCVNLGNALDAPYEGAWGPPLVQGDIDWVAAQGFDSVRLPVRFSAHHDGRIDPAFLARVDEVVGWAIAAGLTVIVDVHHYEAIMSDPTGQADRFVAIWDELAAHYADAPPALVYELLNEPSGMLDNDRLAPLFARAIATIRSHDPDRWIIAGGDRWNAVEALAGLDLPPDPRLIRTFHYYVPYDFTHQLAPWTGQDLPARTWGSADDLARLGRDMARTDQIDGPLFLGEFGVYEGADAEQRATWTRAVRAAAEARGIGWCIWAYGADFAIRDRRTGDWVPGMREALFGP